MVASYTSQLSPQLRKTVGLCLNSISLGEAILRITVLLYLLSTVSENHCFIYLDFVFCFE